MRKCKDDVYILLVDTVPVENVDTSYFMHTVRTNTKKKPVKYKLGRVWPINKNYTEVELRNDGKYL